MTNSEHRRAAKAIRDYWPGFISNLITRARAQILEILKREYDDIDDRTTRDTDGDSHFGIWLCRRSWTEYSQPKHTGRARTSVAVEYWRSKDGKCSDEWQIGIVSPCSKNDMNDCEQKRRRRLVCQLVNRLDDGLHSSPREVWWLLVESLSDDSDDLLQHVQHVVDRFVEIARYAIPVIDEIEGPDRSADPS